MPDVMTHTNGYGLRAPQEMGPHLGSLQKAGVQLPGYCLDGTELCTQHKHTTFAAAQPRPSCMQPSQPDPVGAADAIAFRVAWG